MNPGMPRNRKGSVEFTPEEGDVLVADIGSRYVRFALTVEEGDSTIDTVDLTRFRGPLMVSFRGVHNGEQIGPVHPGVQAFWLVARAQNPAIKVAS